MLDIRFAREPPSSFFMHMLEEIAIRGMLADSASNQWEWKYQEDAVIT
jgi:hypothetical protein